MLFQQFRADVRYALKWLVRSPSFTLVAVASLAIGIGFNTALFAVMDAALLRPLPVERPDRVVDVYTRGSDGDTYATSSYPDFLDFQKQNAVFTGMPAYSPAIAAIKGRDQSRMALGEVVSGNYFQLLGVSAALGRTLLPEDDRPGAPRAVVLSNRTWTRDYARDPAALGKTLLIHGEPYTIVGVAPASFTGMLPMLQPEMWLPLAWIEEVEPAGIQDSVPSPTGNTRLERRGQRWLFVKARLADGETVERAQAQPAGHHAAACGRASEDERETARVRRRERQDPPAGGRDAPADRRSPDAGRRHWSCSWRAPTSPTCCWRARPAVSARSGSGWRSARAAAG